MIQLFQESPITFETGKLSCVHPVRQIKNPIGPLSLPTKLAPEVAALGAAKENFSTAF